MRGDPLVVAVEQLLPERVFEPTKFRLLRPIRSAGVCVPAGFVTDGATVPRALWWLFPPTGRYFVAAAVHDYLLVTGASWRDANEHFRRSMRETGVPPAVVAVMYSAVQVYGRMRSVLFGEKW